jgi:hypothetical protein
MLVCQTSPAATVRTFIKTTGKVRPTPIVVVVSCLQPPTHKHTDARRLLLTLLQHVTVRYNR